MPQTLEQNVQVPAEEVVMEGVLAVPERALGIVLFAHGTGSGRLSPRNNFVARVLNGAGVGTLLLDLLTEHEDRGPEARFDIGLLVRRLVHATAWAERQPSGASAPALGYFGASTGAAAALAAAASSESRVTAVVSRGGRPDLAMAVLGRVRAPTLLIVGGRDRAVLALNQQALEALGGPKRLVVVPGATHLFPEPGALDEVARLAADWFVRHFAPGARAARAAPDPRATGT